MVALDLEKYDFNRGSQTLIRATEGTVLERLPPRIKIRQKAALELPHIMVLIDDPGRTVIEPLFAKKGQVLYDFELMLGGGHLKGYKVESAAVEGVLAALAKLADPQAFQKKYGVKGDKGVLLFAVGDGNHSLATAKSIWELLKKAPASMDHPARYALVELVNVHDQGLVFEPIHRVLFDADGKALFQQMASYLQSNGSKLEKKACGSREEMINTLKKPAEKGTQVIGYVQGNEFGVLLVQNPKHNLAVGSLQAFLDAFFQVNKGAKIDYVHGEQAVADLGSKPGNMGFFLPAMDKQDLFKTVILDGALPRKTFSMGEAEEKRYYLECRKIVP